MATTVHIPKRLLARVDAQAKALGISRNRLVITALEEKLAPQQEWPPDLIRMLKTPVTRAVFEAAGDMVEAIHKARRNRKRSVEL